MAWAGLAVAIAVHVVDETWNDFLSFYNPAVDGIRANYPWVPLPTFSFDQWLLGLILGILLLIGLTPFVSAERTWLRTLSLVFAVLMIANALGHTVMSIWLGEPIPGVYSSPLLLVAAIALFVTAWRAQVARIDQKAP
jgi:hypothetical protein